MNKWKRVLFQCLTPLALTNSSTNRRSKRILLVRDDGIGDFLLFSGVLRLFQQYYGKQSVYLVVKANLADIADLYMPQNQIISVDENRYFSDWKYRITWLNGLRSAGFLTAVSSIHRSSLGDDIIKNSGCIERIGYEGEQLRPEKRKRRKSFYTRIVSTFGKESLARPGKYHHVLQHELQMFREITGQKADLSMADPFLPLPDQAYFFEKFPYVVYLPEAGNEKRAYSPLAMIKIIKQTLSSTIKCVIIASRQGPWQNVINDDSKFIDLTGKVTLREAFSVLKQAIFVIGNETGLTHAAWISGVSTLMIYGGGHYGRFLPLFSNGTSITNPMECFACDWHCCYPDKKFPCISGISEEKIKTAILKECPEPIK